MSFIHMFAAWGLWTGKKWAWWIITSFLFPLLLLLSFVGGFLFGPLVNLIVFLYLLQPHIRSYFGVRLKLPFKRGSARIRDT